MIVVADSGSTKTDWTVVSENGDVVEKIKTIGFNPYFQTSDYIYSVVKEAFSKISSVNNEIEEVFFYGAGCSSDDKKQIVDYALSKIFVNAKIEVDHDMVAASRATLQSSPGIACIIGTGANSCVWDGNNIIDNIPSHGYIFGDEGSGSYLGIELLKLYLNNQMESDLRSEFDKEFNISEDDILNRVYKGVSPNVYLATFATFFTSQAHSKQLQEVVEKGFRLFFETRVVKYSNYQQYKLGFVGSIAFYFKEVLNKVAKDYGMSISTITKCPITNLVEFHSAKDLV